MPWPPSASDARRLPPDRERPTFTGLLVLVVRPSSFVRSPVETRLTASSAACFSLCPKRRGKPRLYGDSTNRTIAAMFDVIPVHLPPS